MTPSGFSNVGNVSNVFSSILRVLFKMLLSFMILVLVSRMKFTFYKIIFGLLKYPFLLTFYHICCIRVVCNYAFGLDFTSSNAFSLCECIICDSLDTNMSILLDQQRTLLSFHCIATFIADYT